MFDLVMTDEERMEEEEEDPFEDEPGRCSNCGELDSDCECYDWPEGEDD